MVKPLPKGARLTAIFDSCHSGTMLDLPFLYKCDGSLEVFTDSRHRKAALAIIQAGLSLVSHEDKRSIFRSIKENMEVLFSLRDPREDMHEQFEEDNTSVADVYQFAGCRDDQVHGVFLKSRKAWSIITHTHPPPMHTKNIDVCRCKDRQCCHWSHESCFGCLPRGEPRTHIRRAPS